jgi:hypothetical protein
MKIFLPKNTINGMNSDELRKSFNDLGLGSRTAVRPSSIIALTESSLVPYRFP